jgi:hypothetical protein
MQAKSGDAMRKASDSVQGTKDQLSSRIHETKEQISSKLHEMAGQSTKVLVDDVESMTSG